MKRLTKALILALCCALVFSSGVYAAGRTKTLTAHYDDLKLVVDGVPVTPRDANGAVVEPFICDGTTYLPVRAIGEALGKTVKWDGNTKTASITGGRVLNEKRRRKQAYERGRFPKRKSSAACSAKALI